MLFRRALKLISGSAALRDFRKHGDHQAMTSTIVFLFFVLLIPILAIAQPAAMKFDEFTLDAPSYYFFDEEVTFKDRLDRLIRQVQREPRSSKVYLIHYRSRVATSPAYTSRWRVDRAEWEITSKVKISYENVISIDGGVRDSDTVEFWIARKGATPPQPTPKYDNLEVVNCPSIWLFEREHNLDQMNPAVFSTSLSPEMQSRFEWTVSPGMIIEGQGTKTIKVDVKGIKRRSVTVLADGVPGECSRVVKRTFEIGNRPIMVDEWGGLPESDLRGRLDAFLAAISNEPSFTGYMIVYGRRSSPRSLAASIRLVNNHLAFRNFPRDRIKIVSGGYRDDGGTEIWLLPPGVKAPVPRPTVDSRFVQQSVKRRRSR